MTRGRKSGTKKLGPRFDRAVQGFVTEEMEKAFLKIVKRESTSSSKLVRDAVADLIERRKGQL